MELKDVLDASGISYGTLRKYIDLGLISSPQVDRHGVGTISHYAEDILNQIQEIQQFKLDGKTLAEIQSIMSGIEIKESPVEQDAVLKYLKSILDKLKSQLDKIIKLESTQVILAEKRVIASRIECIQWQIETIQRPTVFKEQLEQIALSNQLKEKYGGSI